MGRDFLCRHARGLCAHGRGGSDNAVKAGSAPRPRSSVVEVVGGEDGQEREDGAVSLGHRSTGHQGTAGRGGERAPVGDLLGSAPGSAKAAHADFHCARPAGRLTLPVFDVAAL